jgi:hypothetical protein
MKNKAALSTAVMLSILSSFCSINSSGSDNPLHTNVDQNAQISSLGNNAQHFSKMNVDENDYHNSINNALAFNPNRLRQTRSNSSNSFVIGPDYARKKNYTGELKIQPYNRNSLRDRIGQGIRLNNATSNVEQLENNISNKNSKIANILSDGVNSLNDNVSSGLSALNNNINDMRKESTDNTNKLSTMVNEVGNGLHKKLDDMSYRCEDHLCHDRNCKYPKPHPCHDRKCRRNKCYIKQTGANINTSNLWFSMLTVPLFSAGSLLWMKNRKRKFSK